MNIICYADDVVLIASGDDLQRLLHQFITTAKRVNMEIFKEKTKYLTVSKEPLIEDRVIEQVMVYNYLGVDICSARDLNKEVQKQSTKSAIVSGCLRDVIWRNRYMSVENKVRIYKSIVRPILTYASESRTDEGRTRVCTHGFRPTLNMF